MKDDNRQTDPWAVGVGLGLCLSCGAGLAAYAAGYVPALAWLVPLWALFVFGLGFPVVVSGLGAAVLAVIGAWLGYKERTQSTPPDEPDDPEPALPITEQLSRLERQRLQQVAHWQLYFRRLWAAATAYGWDIRTLTDKRRPTCVTSQGGWNLATDQLVAAGYLRKDTAGTVPLVTDADWQAGRLWERVPAPSGEPPDIAPPPYSTPQQKTGQTAANTVIEHERA